MKKLLSLLLCFSLCLCLAACGNKQAPVADDEVGVGTVNDKEVINVGFVQLVDMADAQEMYTSFMDTIANAGLGEKILVDFQSAAGDAGTMSTIIQGFVDNDYDLIVPMLTPPAQAAANICGGEIPIIFMSVVDPVYSKIMPDLNTINPELLATGTSNTIPADLIIETANAITPVAEGQKIYIMYNTSQNNAQCTMEAAAAYCDSKGYAYATVGYADITDAVTQAQALDTADCAYVYVTLDSVIASNFNQLGQTLAEKGIPVYGAADSMTMGGAFCSYGVDYETVGKMTADMVIEWYNGKALEEMPCQQYADFALVVNSDVQQQLNIELPEDYAAQATYVTTK